MKKKKFTVVYCKGFFGDMDGKTANGLARYSDSMKFLASSIALKQAWMQEKCSTINPIKSLSTKISKKLLMEKAVR
ncbi:GFO/IDH/MOCA family oxidoreductase fused to GTPase/ATPase domain [Desulfovibrio ferrophilus]|uniref:GFO/IDH/MOCA family oxidoreductase fused to GTPase/ATPase domain n=1 Tax=Desulfovibrio ferrophilus TaxID=241368 RepID=A0A2Z6AVE7_9BACT|nr:GFO/IDH/MOCA family oxidoreductase fused to GTPase/ATPase domain [Desulfovibrio ferrophilus]